MTHIRIPLVAVASLATVLALGACSKTADQNSTAPAQTEAPPPAAPATAAPPMAAPAQVSVTSVDLGSAVGADQSISTASTTFKPSDTIYASVATSGSGNATLDAKWTFQDGQTVKEDNKTIDASGPERTVFSISKPDGWPAGDYKVAISLDGNPVASKDFTVQ